MNQKWWVVSICGLGGKCLDFCEKKYRVHENDQIVAIRKAYDRFQEFSNSDEIGYDVIEIKLSPGGECEVLEAA